MLRVRVPLATPSFFQGGDRVQKARNPAEKFCAAHGGLFLVRISLRLMGSKCILTSMFIRRSRQRAMQLIWVGHSFLCVAAGLVGLLVLSDSVRAGTLYLPNFSFESQATPFADPRIDSWQKAAQPG